MSFYREYLEMINENVDIQHPQLSDPRFRNMILKDNIPSFEIIQLFSQGVKHTMRKPQRVLHDDEDYYIAIDLNTNTYYVCYKNLLMVDIDFYKKEGDLTTEDIIKLFQKYCKNKPYRFKLYSSRNGIHAFLISQKCNYKQKEDIQIMLDLESDFYYTVYAYLRGWSVRLNKKRDDMEDVLYKYICDVGDAEEDEHLVKLVNLHINLVDVFKNTKPNTM